MDEKDILVNTLTDSVTDKDALGSHQRIADAIAELIESEESGKSIALTGPWGSGKSSVIEMMKDKLKDTTSLFVFDAWAHEGDPLRRSFLENLIDYLPQNWIDKGKWSIYKDELAKRRETTKVTNYSELTCFGISLTITAVLVPVGFAILNQLDWVTLTWTHAMGLALSLSPILLGLGKLCISRKELKDPKSRKKVFALLTGESTKRFRSDTYRTTDPTAIEFREAYNKILSEALKGNDRTLIIVVDNLDRLDSKNALAMWATMKTFLDFGPLRSNDWSKKLWLIVPFDPQATQLLWDGDGEGKGKNDGADNYHRDLASSFIEKTFQLSFHVPYPVLSNWVEYFKNQLRLALPRENDEEVINTVYRIFRRRKLKGGKPPTPRTIKKFINRMGAIYRIWHEDISLSHIALYVAIESVEGINVEELQGDDTILTDQFSREQIGYDYRESLAAIYFNVTKENAMQALLGPKLLDAIHQESEKQVLEMSAIPGFHKVLEEIVESNCQYWAKDFPTHIPWLASITNAAGADTEFSLLRVWRLLANSAKNVTNWTTLNGKLGLGISRLIEYKDDLKFSKAMIRSISNTALEERDEAKDDDETRIAEWLSGCSIVLDIISSMHEDEQGNKQGDIIIELNFSCPGTATTYLEIIDFAINNDEYPEEFLVKFRPMVDPKDVSLILNTHVTDGKYSAGSHKIATLLRRIVAGWDWPGFVQALSTRIKAPSSVESPELEEVLDTLIEFGRDLNEAEEVLETMVANGDCHHHLHSAFTKKESITTSLCIYLILKYKFISVPPLPTPVGKTLEGVKNYQSIIGDSNLIDFAIDDFVDLLISNNDTNMLFDEHMRKKEFQSIRYAIVKQLCDRDNLVELVNVDMFLNNEACFYSALETKKYQLVVDQYIENAELENHVVSLPFNSFLASLYGAIVNSSKSKLDKMQTYILSGLKSIKREEWVKELDAEYYNVFRLLRDLHDKKIKVGLRTDYREALDEYKALVIKGSVPKAALSEHWSVFMAVLDNNLRKTYIDQIIDEIIERTDEAVAIIGLFGTTLMDCKRLEGKIDQIVSKGFRRFFEKSNIVALEWVNSVLQSCPKIIKKCSEENRETFIDFVRTKLEGNQLEGDLSKIMEKMGAELGIEIKEDEAPEESVDE